MKNGAFRRWFAGISLCAVLAGCMTLPAQAVTFKDVPSDHWAAKEIIRCAEQGIFKGQGGNLFGLGKSMSRAEFVVVLSRYFGWSPVAVKHTSFSDVSEDAWYLSELQAAYEHGAVTRSSSLFRPNDSITREEVAVALTRALGYGAVAGIVSESAAVPRDVYTNRGYIGVAYAFELVNGYNKNTFAPKEIATREQIAVILMRMQDKQYRDEKRMAVLFAEEDLTDTEHCDSFAVSAAKIVNQKGLRLDPTMKGAVETDLLRRIQGDGKAALLRVTGAEDAWQSVPDEAATLLASAISERGYDGIYLDLECGSGGSSHLAALAAALRGAMPEKQLVIAVDAPADVDGSESYQVIGNIADRVILKVPALETSMGNLPVAVSEPLEDCYTGLLHLKKSIPAEKLFLQISTAASCWSGLQKTQMTEQTIERIMAQGTMYQSVQYHATYFRSGHQTVWYLGDEGIRMREQLVALLGCQGVCIMGSQS